jgi:monoterpene epsilon-lactone hydrolase
MPSWQSRVATVLMRVLVKKRPPLDEGGAVRMVRAKLDRKRGIPRPKPPGLAIRQVDEGGIKGEWITPQTLREGRTLYYLHGGGYIACSPRTHRPITGALAHLMCARTFALDYRLAPEHRFPAALDDAVAGYRWMIGQGIDPREIVLAGDSAGGGLLLSLLVSLRDQGVPLPSAGACLSAWTDLAGTGESLDRNEKSDPIFYSDVVRHGSRVYLGEESPRNPLASPLYADLHGLPPLLFHVSSSEVLLDDSTRLAARVRESGGEAELKIWDRLPHVWQVLTGFTPEADASLREIADFLSRKKVAESGRSNALQTPDLSVAAR